jgi:NAD(P)-dependent dehydrogenase (short-subunit alcohol dehydrogenase family)
MTGTKDTIHREYLKDQEARTALPELPWEDRTVLIVGSDEDVNIGAMTARDVVDHGGHVIEVDKTMREHELFKHCETATDLVICCASVHMAWIEDCRDGEIRDVVENTLIAPIHYTSVFAWSRMDEPHRKHIVFVGSMAHRQVLNASSAYCASKAGLAHFARCMAWELTPKGFTIGMVHPGNVIGTNMTQDTIDGIAEYRNITIPEAEDYWKSQKLTKKWLKPKEVAREVVDLLQSDDHHSGVQIELGGGMR